MKSDCPGLRALARLALLVLLLAAQAVVLAHDIDHLGASGDTLCEVCSASHVQDAATLETVTGAIYETRRAGGLPQPSATERRDRPVRVRARSPPDSP